MKKRKFLSKLFISALFLGLTVGIYAQGNMEAVDNVQTGRMLAQESGVTEEVNKDNFIETPTGINAQKTELTSTINLATSGVFSESVNHISDYGYAWYKDATSDTPYGNVGAYTLVLDGLNLNVADGYGISAEDIALTEDTTLTILVAENSVNTINANGYSVYGIRYSAEYVPGAGQTKTNMEIIYGDNAYLYFKSTGDYPCAVYNEGTLVLDGGYSDFQVVVTDIDERHVLGGIEGTYLRNGAKLYGKNTSNLWAKCASNISKLRFIY